MRPFKNIPAVKNGMSLKKALKKKNCEIKGGIQEVAMTMLRFTYNILAKCFWPFLGCRL